MRRWVSASAVRLPDYASMPRYTRVETGQWDSLGLRVEVCKDTPYGVMILRTIPCASRDEADAVAAATTLQSEFGE